MRRPPLRRLLRPLLLTVLLLLLALAATGLSLLITPQQTVSAAGQSVRVGATSLQLSPSGPGELVLFGQTIPTKPQFDGPIRPRLELARIATGPQVSKLVQNGGHGSLVLAVGHELTSGWVRYAVWETVIATGVMLVVLAAVTGLRHLPRRRTAAVLGAGLVSVCAVNLIGFGLLANSTPQVLDHVRSLEDLVGRGPLTPVPPASGPHLTEVHAVVIGDSTAAAPGNAPLPNPTPLDTACVRSVDAYARDLAEVNGWNVLNLACTGATVPDGVLGVQIVSGHQVAPPQLAEAQRATKAPVLIISVGANDVGWADLTRLCAVSTTCDDRATTAFFRNRLTRFAVDYRTLLRQVSTLPQHPTVLVNEYYDPFGPNADCLKGEGITTAKADMLRSRLTELNTVLRDGADLAGAHPVRPSFTGHELCSTESYVQGPASAAPLHPTPAGELVIALADQQALTDLPR
ncbi:GDSL-type esterase/lipase family protein [Actinacidiphila acididurans]|uniref:GDSL-type esterase/lipase family protein n=1 Tax=Actinacidiphila acididurans TaxID=2784346 RepID=UPI0027DCE879|nr:GDSL-type esterase/lipase family protein [Actinacidiphila acididurans]